MLTPYEFGLQVGAVTKTAAEKAARGLVADALLYSNPFTGVPTAAYDTYNNLRQGKYLGAVGNVASGAMSFAAPAAVGAGLKATGVGALRAGARVGTNNMLGGALRGAGKALTSSGRAINSAVKPMTSAFAGMNNAVSRGVQSVLPQRAGATFSRAPVQAATNWAGKNPIELASYAGLAAGAGTAARQPTQPTSSLPNTAPQAA